MDLVLLHFEGLSLLLKGTLVSIWPNAGPSFSSLYPCCGITLEIEKKNRAMSVTVGIL